MKKLGECDKKLGLLLKSVGEVEDKKAICDEKMVDLQSLLVESKQNQNDPPLQKQVTIIERETNTMTQELEGI